METRANPCRMVRSVRNKVCRSERVIAVCKVTGGRTAQRKIAIAFATRASADTMIDGQSKRPELFALNTEIPGGDIIAAERGSLDYRRGVSSRLERRLRTKVIVALSERWPRHPPRGFFLIAAHRLESTVSSSITPSREFRGTADRPFRIYLALRENVRFDVKRQKKKKEKKRKGGRNPRGINESERIIDSSRQLSISRLSIACYYFQSGNDFGYLIGIAVRNATVNTFVE